MALWSTQPLTEMSTRNIFWGEGGKGGWFVGLTTLAPSFVDCLEIWEPEPPGTRRACARIAFHLFYYIYDTCLFSAFISSPTSSVERFRFYFWWRILKSSWVSNLVDLQVVTDVTKLKQYGLPQRSHLFTSRNGATFWKTWTSLKLPHPF